MPEEDFADGCHYSFFYDNVAFMNLEVAIATDIGEVVRFVGVGDISTLDVVLDENVKFFTNFAGLCTCCV